MAQRKRSTTRSPRSSLQIQREYEQYWSWRDTQLALREDSIRNGGVSEDVTADFSGSVLTINGGTTDFSNFTVGMKIIVSGATNFGNDAASAFTIASVSDTSMTFEETIGASGETAVSITVSENWNPGDPDFATKLNTELTTVEEALRAGGSTSTYTDYSNSGDYIASFKTSISDTLTAENVLSS